ncbi:putative metal-dependent hydrolase YcfH [Glandiceps talaboti]
MFGDNVIPTPREMPPSCPAEVPMEGGDRIGADVSSSVLAIVKKNCSLNQPIHLHAFSGDWSTACHWIRVFQNCYFGFTDGVASFCAVQVEALRKIPEDCLLLETDSPYFPVPGGLKPNTPTFIGDVAVLVADRHGLKLVRLLESTVANTRRLYGFT